MITFSEQFIAPLLLCRNLSTPSFHINNRDYTYSQFFDVIEQVFEIVSVLPDKLIGLYATDDIRTYASIVALWFCGKAYVPLNPSQPRERHIEVIKSVRLLHILSADDSYNIGLEGVNTIKTNQCIVEEYKRKNTIKIVDVPDTSLAYVLFTSGSTGKPKGVQISRGNLAAFIDSMNHIGLNITSDDLCLQPFDLTFDFSVSSYIIPLVNGASIYTIPNKAVKFTYIAELLEEYHLTVLQMVPSMIRNLLPYLDEVDLSSVRYNILCGEALTDKVINKWHEANTNMVSYNMYGPTEDTVFCTYYLVDKSNYTFPLVYNDIVSIGKTFDNSGLLLIDDNNQVISKSDTKGELCLCGSQLTPGYWENPEENKAKFLMVDGVRYYRTGDLCYYGDDGNLIFVCRKDFQVKINGFRVELGEIESRYSNISGGRFSVVIPYSNEQGNTELAIVVEGREYDYHEHLIALANELPVYEVPNKWLFISSIPQNQNGKIDRKVIKRKFNL